jgi:hypothetical protein
LDPAVERDPRKREIPAGVHPDEGRDRNDPLLLGDLVRLFLSSENQQRFRQTFFPEMIDSIPYNSTELPHYVQRASERKLVFPVVVISR